LTDIKCKICNDSGWERTEKDGKEFLKKCKCQRMEILKDRCLSANIPPKFAGLMLQSFGTENGDPSLLRLVKIANKFIERYPIGKGIILHGQTGMGKTHLMCTIATEILKKFPRTDIFYIDWNDMVREMKSGESHTFRDFSVINSTIERMSKADLLILDELGASQPSQWVRDNIYYIINYRYNRQKMTMFATNYFDDTPDGSPTIRERVGDRVRSRIFEMAESFNLSGIDYRHKYKD